ncbi:hypothetical protein AMTR_s00055p00210620, partial [Amborella trichopoda]
YQRLSKLVFKERIRNMATTWALLQLEFWGFNAIELIKDCMTLALLGPPFLST